MEKLMYAMMKGCHFILDDCAYYYIPETNKFYWVEGRRPSVMAGTEIPRENMILFLQEVDICEEFSYVKEHLLHYHDHYKSLETRLYMEGLLV